jgi:threonine synthase
MDASRGTFPTAASSRLTHLECPQCGARHDASAVANVCECGSPLLARYDLDAVRATVDPERITARPPTLWRYAELLPVRDHASVVSLGETMTPLLAMSRLARSLEIGELWIKDEGRLPTGTFKARGAAVGVSRARELGITHIAMPTNGNAGAAWAAYVARAGMRMTVVVPREAPQIPAREMTVTGADTYVIDGLISDAARVVADGIRRHGWFDASTLREPYRLEGKKTMGIELFEQLGWQLPDVIVYPTGGGVGLIGIAKALEELDQLGWISGPWPRLVAAQASGCAPVVRAWESGAATVEPWDGARTIAFGVTVPKPLGDRLILAALKRTDGCAVAVDDADTLKELDLVARSEGLFMCPEGALTVAAARRLRRDGWITPRDRVALINTGAGSLYPDCVTSRPLELGEPPMLP